MTTTTMRKLRANLKAYFDAVNNDRDILLVTRQGDKEAIVIMSLSEYNSMKETEYLLSSEENRTTMEKALKELGEGNVQEFSLPE